MKIEFCLKYFGCMHGIEIESRNTAFPSKMKTEEVNIALDFGICTFKSIIFCKFLKIMERKPFINFCYKMKDFGKYITKLIQIR